MDTKTNKCKNCFQAVADTEQRCGCGRCNEYYDDTKIVTIVKGKRTVTDRDASSWLGVLIFFAVALLLFALVETMMVFNYTDLITAAIMIASHLIIGSVFALLAFAVRVASAARTKGPDNTILPKVLVILLCIVAAGYILLYTLFQLGIIAGVALLDFGGSTIAIAMIAIIMTVNLFFIVMMFGLTVILLLDKHKTFFKPIRRKVLWILLTVSVVLYLIMIIGIGLLQGLILLGSSAMAIVLFYLPYLVAQVVLVIYNSRVISQEMKEEF